MSPSTAAHGRAGATLSPAPVRSSAPFPSWDVGHRAIFARVRVAIPNEPHAQAAEAAGCAAGLRLLLGILGGPRAARVTGGNAAAVRHGAGIGRL